MLRPTRILPAIVAFCLFSAAADHDAQSPSILLDINPGSSSSLPARFVNVLGTTYFTAASPGFGHALWKTDGTPAGTKMVKDMYPGPKGGVQPRELTPLGNLLICIGDDGINGGELWRSDGTTSGTRMILNINPGNQGRPIYMDPPTGLTYFKNRVYFSARDGIHGRELWSTDGTANGTSMVKDIRPGGNTSDSMPSYLTVVGDTLYFFANDITHGWELWKTDGTGIGTTLVKDVWPGPEPTFMTHNNYPFNTGALGKMLIFAAPNPTYGYELWKSDGTTPGTTLLKDITTGTGNSYFYRNLTQAGGLVFFSANDGMVGLELWCSDGTTKGTRLVKDIHSGSGNANPGNMAVFGSTVVFGADDGVNGSELWKSDGTPAGTVMVKQIRPGSTGSMKYYNIAKVGSRYAYFSADDGSRGTELWRTDGTAAGTTLFQDLAVGYAGSYPDNLTHSGGRIIFRAQDSAHGQEPRVVFPGATAQVHGEAHSLPGVSPGLTATDPVLGQTFTISGVAAKPSSPISLVIGYPGPPLLFPNGCRVYINLALPFGLLKEVRVPSTTWSHPVFLPNIPGLTGYSFALQAAQLLPGTSLGFDTTPAVIMTAGY